MPAGMKYLVRASIGGGPNWVFAVERDHDLQTTTKIDETDSGVPLDQPCPSFPFKLIPKDEKRKTIPIFYMDRKVTLESPDIHQWRARFPDGYVPKARMIETSISEDEIPDEVPIHLTRLSAGEVARQALALMCESIETEEATLTAFEQVKRQRDDARSELKLAQQTESGALDAQAEAEKKWFAAREERNAAIELLRGCYNDAWSDEETLKHDANIEEFFKKIGEKL